MRLKKNSLLTAVVITLTYIMSPYQTAFAECQIKLVLPTNTATLPRENHISVEIAPSDVLKEIKKGNMHLYFFQKNQLEKTQIWHFVAKPQYPIGAFFNGTTWLGGKNLGANEDYVFRVILSTQKRGYQTGPNDEDIVNEQDLPNPITCEEAFGLHRER